jgi:hypothetical protein
LVKEKEKASGALLLDLPVKVSCSYLATAVKGIGHEFQISFQVTFSVANGIKVKLDLIVRDFKFGDVTS